MTQRTLVVCCFGLLVLGQGSVSEAGGFLRRIFGRSEGRSTVRVSATACNRTPASAPMASVAPTIVEVAPTIVEVEGIQATRGSNQAKERKREQIVHLPLTAEQSFEKHCKACEIVFADGKKKKKCKEIAKILHDKKNQKDYVEYTPNETPCACHFPEWPNGDICLEIYEQDINSPDPQIRECAADCFMACVLSNPAFLRATDSQ